MRLSGRLPQRRTVAGRWSGTVVVLLVGTQVEWQEAHVRRTMTELAHLESSATRIEADVMDVPQRSAPRCPVFPHPLKSPTLPPAVLCGCTARGRKRSSRTLHFVCVVPPMYPRTIAPNQQRAPHTVGLHVHWREPTASCYCAQWHDGSMCWCELCPSRLPLPSCVSLHIPTSLRTRAPDGMRSKSHVAPRARAHAQRPGCRARGVVRRSHSAARATRCSAVAPQHTRIEGPLVLQVSSMAAGRGIKRPTQSTGE